MKLHHRGLSQFQTEQNGRTRRALRARRGQVRCRRLAEERKTLDVAAEGSQRRGCTNRFALLPVGEGANNFGIVAVRRGENQCGPPFESRRFGFAPLLRSSFTNAAFPFMAAVIRGVSPSRFARSIFAPALSRTRPTSALPV